MIVCAFSCPAWAADHAKTLIDANLAIANWKVTSADWGEKGGPAWSVQLRTLHGGRQEGVQVLDVDNGVMKFTIVPTRGFEIWKAEVSKQGGGKLRLGWDSPVHDIIHPSYIRLTDNGGQGWVAGFGGLMARGGLASFGSPGQDGDQQLASANKSESFLLFDGAVGDRPENLRIEPSVPRQLLRIHVVALAVAV